MSQLICLTLFDSIPFLELHLKPKIIYFAQKVCKSVQKYTFV